MTQKNIGRLKRMAAPGYLSPQFQLSGLLRQGCRGGIREVAARRLGAG